MHLLVMFLLYIIRMAVELACFFVLIKVLQNVCPRDRLLAAFSHAGKPIVDGLLSLFEKHSTARRLRENVKLVICAGVLSIISLLSSIRFDFS